MRDFNEWLSDFRESIADYGYYIDFEKVHRNVDAIKVELNILNSLIGSKSIEMDFENILGKYPEVLKCIPILLAVRASEIYAIDKNGSLMAQPPKSTENKVIKTQVPLDFSNLSFTLTEVKLDKQIQKIEHELRERKVMCIKVKKQIKKQERKQSDA